MKKINSNSELEVGKYYHCFSNDTGSHSIHKCYDCSDGTKYIGDNHIWADDGNNQALKKWRMFEVGVPQVGTMYLYSKQVNNER